MTAYLTVRAEVPESDLAEFDRWYETEHLPDAHKAFNALSAKRGWSSLDPTLHVAFYEFPDLAAAEAAANSGEIKELIAEFDRVWQDRVVRTREILDIAQTL